MKLVRYGELGRERPGILDAGGKIRDLSGMVEDPKLLEVVRGAANLEAAVAGLVDAANQAGGTDNITVLALQCLANGVAG